MPADFLPFSNAVNVDDSLDGNIGPGSLPRISFHAVRALCSAGENGNSPASEPFSRKT